MAFDRDDWESSLEYTWLHFKTTSSNFRAEANADLYPITNFTSGHTAYGLTSAKGPWKIKYDILDLNLGRNYYVEKKRHLKPFVGLRGGRINQKDTLDYNLLLNAVEYPATVRSKEKTWLVGPIIGFNLDYIFDHGFKMFAKNSFSLLYQSFKNTLSNKHPASRSMTDIDKAYNNTDKETPNVSLGLGLAWGYYFSNNQFHLNVAASYDFEYFWNQNFMTQLLIAQTHRGFTQPIEDLFLHGLTTSIRFDF